MLGEVKVEEVAIKHKSISPSRVQTEEGRWRVNYLYEGKSLTLLKGVLRHSFIYLKIFYQEVEIARWELGDWFSPPLLLLYLLHHLVL